MKKTSVGFIVIGNLPVTARITMNNCRMKFLLYGIFEF